MNVLSFSYCYPNHAAPNWGIFVHQRLAAMACRDAVQVVAPVPSFPVVNWLRGNAGPIRERWQGLTVHRPRFFCVPGLFKSYDARLYARGVRPLLRELVRDFQPDVLDAHFIWPDGVGVSILARELGLPYVITLRGWLYEALKRPRILPQCVEALRQADAVIAVSSHLAQTAVELGADPRTMHVIANGVDRERFQPRDRQEARRELGLPEPGRLIVSVAHLGPRKGHRETIRALATLPADVRLAIVGGDPRGNRNERELRALVEQLGLGDRVILTGRQPYAKVPRYFNAADFSILASYREGCPNVVLESLASGVPVVATRVGNVTDMIQPGVNGRIVPPETVEPLAEGMAAMLDDLNRNPGWCSSPAVRGWDEVATDACDVLRTACGAGRQKSPLPVLREWAGRG